MDTADIKTPIYDVYYALIENGVLDIDQFSQEDATPIGTDRIQACSSSVRPRYLARSLPN